MLSVEVKNEKEAKEFLDRFQKIMKSNGKRTHRLSDTLLDIDSDTGDFFDNYSVNYNVDEKTVECYYLGNFNFNLKQIKSFSLIAEAFMMANKFIEIDVSEFDKAEVTERIDRLYDKLTFGKYDNKDIPFTDYKVVGATDTGFSVFVQGYNSFLEKNVPIEIQYDEENNKLKMFIDSKYTEGVFVEGIKEDEDVEDMFDYIKSELFVW